MTMLPQRPVCRSVNDPSMVGEVRRIAMRMAADCRFGETEAGKIAIVATELANNLLRHAQSGWMILQPDARSGLEILSLDKGPGIPDLGRALRDGFSTIGTAGNGLGSLARLADDFDIFSNTTTGTAVLCRFHPGGPGSENAASLVGGVSIPKPGEHVCGDAWACHLTATKTFILLADGLGHGPDAAEASQEAVGVFRANATCSPREILLRCHDALRKTRGAAISVAEIDHVNGRVIYAGVGNVLGTILLPDASSRSLVGFNGTVGAEARKVQELTYPWTGNSTLVLCSDGLLSQWRLDKHPGILSRDPSLIAGVLYRDFARGRDDATAVVARQREPHGA